MFDFWSEGPRTWKWLVPGALVMMSLPVMYQLWMTGIDMWQLTAISVMGVDGLLILAAITNWWRLKSKHQEELYRDHAEAMNTTPVVTLAKYMQTMHPDAVKVLNKFGVRTSWQVRLNMDNSQRDWVLSDTNTHFGFIEYVLHQSGEALYPKRSLSEGSKKWDPDGLVTDREQYDDLEKWLRARLMVTRSFGDYKPAEFIPPWTPELVLDVLGLTGEQELYRPEEENFAAKQLPAESAKREENVEHGATKAEVIQDPSAEELEAISIEQARYAQKFVGGKVRS